MTKKKKPELFDTSKFKVTQPKESLSLFDGDYEIGTVQSTTDCVMLTIYDEQGFSFYATLDKDTVVELNAWLSAWLKQQEAQ